MRVGDVLRHKYDKKVTFQVFAISGDTVHFLVSNIDSNLGYYESYTKKQVKDYFIIRSKHFKTGGNI